MASMQVIRRLFWALLVARAPMCACLINSLNHLSIFLMAAWAHMSATLGVTRGTNGSHTLRGLARPTLLLRVTRGAALAIALLSFSSHFFRESRGRLHAAHWAFFLIIMAASLVGMSSVVVRESGVRTTKTSHVNIESASWYKFGNVEHAHTRLHQLFMCASCTPRATTTRVSQSSRAKWTVRWSPPRPRVVFPCPPPMHPALCARAPSAPWRA